MGLSISLLAGATHASINVLLRTADAQAIHAAWAAGSFDELLGWCKCAEHVCIWPAVLLQRCSMHVPAEAQGLTEKKLSKN